MGGTLRVQIGKGSPTRGYGGNGLVVGGVGYEGWLSRETDPTDLTYISG